MTSSEEQVRAAVAQQAGTWFIANQAGTLEREERAAFFAWLKASPVHVEEYLGIALVAHDLPEAADDPAVPLEALLELAGADRSEGVVQLETALTAMGPGPGRGRAPPRWSLAASAAAAVLLLAASTLWWFRNGEILGLPRGYQTAHGEQLSVRLPDGSVLDLNTDSAVTVRYARSERVVEIERGQALFTVAQDDYRRFRVAAGRVHIIAEGTRYDTYRRPDATIVTVVEGTVAVLARQPPSRGAAAVPPDAQRVGAGFQLQIDADGRWTHPVPVNVQHAVAWLQQRIVFDRRPLGEVADEFNRYGAPSIEVDDASLRALPITGAFNTADVDSFVAFLQTLDGVRVERDDGRVRVLRVKSEGH